MSRMIGVFILAVGAVLLYFAYQSSTAPVDQAVTAVTGSHTNTTIIYVIAGLASAIGGLWLTLFGRPSA